MFIKSVEWLLEAFHLSLVVAFLVSAVDFPLWMIGYSVLNFVSLYFALGLLIFAFLMIPCWSKHLLGECPITWLQNQIRGRLDKPLYTSFIHHIVTDYLGLDSGIMNASKMRKVFYLFIPVAALSRGFAYFI